MREAIPVGSCRRQAAVGATLVVALFLAMRTAGAPGMMRLIHPIGGAQCAIRATTRVAPTAAW